MSAAKNAVPELNSDFEPAPSKESAKETKEKNKAASLRNVTVLMTERNSNTDMSTKTAKKDAHAMTEHTNARTTNLAKNPFHAKVK